MTQIKKRILFIAPQPFFQWRGSPIRVGYNVRALAELGYEVDLLALPFGEDQPIEGVRLIRAPNLFRIRDMPIGPSFWKGVYDVILFFHAWKLIRRQRYDVLHCVEDAAAIGVPLARLSNAALIFEKHSDPMSYRRNVLRNIILWFYSRLEVFSIRHADAVIGTGPALVEQAKAVASNKPVHHIFDIPSSLIEPSEQKAQAVRKQLVPAPDEILVAYVGSFAVYQGIELIFGAIPRVTRRCPRVRFVIIGGTSGEIEERRRALAAEGVDDRVTFLGKIPPDQLPHTLAASDILLSPRIAGANTPLKLLDYLKAGGAIVATDNQANRLILDESTALFVRPELDSFADGICRLAENAALRHQLACKGRALIQGTYNFNEFKRRLGEVYAPLE